jgi:hypothetical protein
MSITFQERAYDILRQFEDGLTCPEFEALSDTAQDKRNASARLSQFVKEGLAEKAGTRINEKTGQICIVYRATGVPFSKRIVEVRNPKRKRRRPTETELLELRAWKAAAIERFPELATSPALIEARQRVAAIFEEQGSPVKATMVRSGEMDDCEMMRVVARLIEGGAA